MVRIFQTNDAVAKVSILLKSGTEAKTVSQSHSLPDKYNTYKWFLHFTIAKGRLHCCHLLWKQDENNESNEKMENWSFTSPVA